MTKKKERKTIDEFMRLHLKQDGTTEERKTRVKVSGLDHASRRS